MVTVSRFSVIVSVTLCGVMLVFGSPRADAARKHHRAEDVSARRHHDRQNENAEAPTRRRHHTADEAESAPVVKHRKSAHELRLERLKAERAANAALSAHLHRLYLAEAAAKHQYLERAAAYRTHLARIAEYRRERVAELNGDVASKSIRVWEAYVVSVPIRLISVDLNDPSVKVSALLAANGIGSAEPFDRMIRRSQPDVAVTGTFFSLDNLRPVGDIVINGDLAYFGGMGTALCITRDNQAQMITVSWGHHHDWSSFEFVMACGPRLLEQGQIVLDPGSERFRDRHMLEPNSRIGVGITATNKLVFVMTQKPIYLGRLAKIMRAEGCEDAMNLDAGTSTGFYCDGNMMARPGRWLTNAIVIYANQHQSRADALLTPSAITKHAS